MWYDIIWAARPQYHQILDMIIIGECIAIVCKRAAENVSSFSPHVDAAAVVRLAAAEQLRCAVPGEDSEGRELTRDSVPLPVLATCPSTDMEWTVAQVGHYIACVRSERAAASG